MMESFQISETPTLTEPCLIAAWPGMGGVAMTAVNYLRDKLKAKPFADIAPGDFFAPTGATVSRQILLPPEPPSNKFYFYQSPDARSDILFFIGNTQPIPHKEHAFASKVLDFAVNFGVRIVYTTAAAPSDMHFKDKPRVFAVPNHAHLLKRLMEYKVHFMQDGSIAGLNGLLVSVAAQKEMRGICFLGEIPFFTAQIEFPHAAIAILDVITKMIGVRIDMVDLELYAAQKQKEIAPLSALLVKDDRPQERNPEKEEEKIVPGQPEPEVSETVRLLVEKLFRQAEFDGSYKSKMRLKETLDQYGLFDEYLDRFLDLFKKSS